MVARASCRLPPLLTLPAKNTTLQYMARMNHRRDAAGSAVHYAAVPATCPAPPPWLPLPCEPSAFRGHMAAAASPAEQAGTAPHYPALGDQPAPPGHRSTLPTLTHPSCPGRVQCGGTTLGQTRRTPTHPGAPRCFWTHTRALWRRWDFLAGPPDAVLVSPSCSATQTLIYYQHRLISSTAHATLVTAASKRAYGDFCHVTRYPRNNLPRFIVVTGSAFQRLLKNPMDVSRLFLA